MRKLKPNERYHAEELRKLKTLCVGQADDLKIETGKERVWLSRCGIEDGEPFDNKVTIEEFIKGQWTTTEEYEG